MIRYASDIDVSRPAEEAFAAVLDITRWGEWTEMRDIRAQQGGPPRVGTTGTFTVPGPFKGPIHFELTALEPNRRVEYRLTHPGFDWRAEVDVEPRPGGSRLTNWGEYRLLGWRRVLEPIVAREIRNGEAAELPRLKALIEASPAGAPAAAEA
jgi:polyketide cyclase/dehydrase/lipid transport protein